MSTCGTSSCEAEAVCRAFWPGRDPIAFCRPCRDRAEGISQAMGFYLHIEEIADDAGIRPASEEA